MRIEANKIAVRRFGLVLQRLDGNKRAIGEAMGDRDVELLLKTISGRSKLRVADMKKGRLYTVHCCPMAHTDSAPLPSALSTLLSMPQRTLCPTAALPSYALQGPSTSMRSPCSHLAAYGCTR